MWYKGVIQKNMMDLGLSGWMADFGEYVPADGAFFYSNETGRVVHNKWPRLWAEVNRMATDESNVTGDVVFWMRAGAAGVGNYTTLMWAGDQNVDFSYADGLPSTIPAALNMGMSGVGITHFDIGGYTTAAQFRALGQALVRSDELLLRSAEAAVFTPMFRSHEGNQPQANVQFYSNDYIEQQFGRLSRMFVHIANYTRHVVQENSLFGTPAQRPLFMEFPDDPAAWAVTYQYMYGDKVLVAPVIATNVTSQTVYLPKGPGSAGWHFLWSDRSYPGGQFANVPAPIGQPPVFYLSSPEYDDIFTAVKRKFPLVQPPPPTTPHAETSTVSTKSTNSCTSVHVLNSLIMMCVVLHVF
ncbi:hypothetical protein DPMN_000478 [Dreissena polymorpha]|uniref:Uncharacterized protein n=2 Tax=Dreissena polymorpha TaxID=45954 RepID=A0A9D4RPJ0_DREPO|nr:hypothetical protein DPMN_000478 [Dreissena polymorpha]